MLTNDMQQFVVGLGDKAVVINGSRWDDIHSRMIRNVNCIELCTRGSPARDVMYMWVYNPTSCNYEMYSKTYLSPTEFVKALETDKDGPILVATTHDGFMNHLQHDGIEYLEECKFDLWQQNDEAVCLMYVTTPPTIKCPFESLTALLECNGPS